MGQDEADNEDIAANDTEAVSHTGAGTGHKEDPYSMPTPTSSQPPLPPPPPPPPPQYYAPSGWSPFNWWYSPPPPPPPKDAEYSWEYGDFGTYHRWRQRIESLRAREGKSQIFTYLKYMILIIMVSNIIIAGSLVIIPELKLGGTGTLHGTVKDVEGNPVSGARVVLEDGRSVYTGSDGGFTLSNVRKGAVFLEVIPPNSTYSSTRYSTFFTGDGNASIVLEKRGLEMGVINDELSLPLAAALVVSVLILININALRLMNRRRGYSYAIASGFTAFGSVLLFIVSVAGYYSAYSAVNPIPIYAVMANSVLSIVTVLFAYSNKSHFDVYLED